MVDGQATKVLAPRRWTALCAAVGVNVCRFALALTFLFSGLVKVIDPQGFAYKLTDYGRAFGLEALTGHSIPLLAGLAVSVFEFLMGVSLLFGISRKGTSRVVVLFLTAMSALTLYLALKNPVADCGCFGDALVLTNWQTFGKNLLLLLFAAAICVGHRHVARLISVHTHWMVTIYALLYALAVATYALVRLPIVDFRPFRIGADLAAEPRFTTTFVMQKDGKTREFGADDYPYDDPSWTLVETRTTQEGENHEFEMSDRTTGEDISRQVVERRGYTFLLLLPDIATADNSVMDELNRLHDDAKALGYPMYALTDFSEGGDSLVDAWCDITGAEYPFYHSEGLTLKTMVRSNPGLLLLKDGRVAGKWSKTNIPTAKEAVSTPPRDAAPWTRLLLFFLVPVAAILVVDRIGYAGKILFRKLIRHTHNNP